MTKDSELVKMLLQRDETAVAELERMYGSYMRSVAYSVLKNAADTEECVNDALLRVWNSIPPAAPEILKPFLKEITKNLAIDRYRQTHRKKDIPDGMTVSIDDIVEKSIDPAGNAESHPGPEITELIADFLRTQSERKVAVFVARYYYDERVADIAAKLKLPKNTVLSDLYRLRKGLAEFLEKEGVTL